MDAEKKRSQGTCAPRKGKEKVTLLIVCCTLLSLYILAEFSHFGNLRRFYASSDVEAKDAANNGSVATIASYFRKPDTLDSKGDAEEKSSEFLSANSTFPGARDWHDYWTIASRKGKDQIDQSHIHDDYVASAAESASKATLQHIDEMKSRYESVNALADFYARGLGWIQDRLDMVLTVVIAGNYTDNSTADNITLHAGPASIFIVDTIGKMKCGGRDDTWAENQPPLTMWVRANGPEIFAGTAIPHILKSSSPLDNHRCTWRYDFEPKNAGVYSIHVKVLTFNGFVDSLREKCNVAKIPSQNDQFDGQKHKELIKGDLEKLEAMNYEVVRQLAEEGNYTHHRGVSGFKMYGECHWKYQQE